MGRQASLSPGVRAAYRVRRRLRLVAGAHWDESALEGRLRALVGFNCLERRGDRLLLEYDAGNLQLDTLLGVLEEAGVGLRGGWYSRVCLNWYRFGDANVWAQSRETTSTCCSQSPLRHR